MSSDKGVRFDGRRRPPEHSPVGKLLTVADALGNDASEHSATRRRLILEAVDALQAYPTRTVITDSEGHLYVSAMNAGFRFGQEVALVPLDSAA